MWAILLQEDKKKKRLFMLFTLRALYCLYIELNFIWNARRNIWDKVNTSNINEISWAWQSKTSRDEEPVCAQIVNFDTVPWWKTEEEKKERQMGDLSVTQRWPFPLITHYNSTTPRTHTHTQEMWAKVSINHWCALRSSCNWHAVM